MRTQLNEEYLAYWGMTKPPFALTPDPDMLYLSSQHSECLLRLKYAIFSHKGGALLVSDSAGNGKTSVLARLQKDLVEYYSGRVRVVFIDHPTLSPIEMIGEISRQLGGEMHTTEKIRSLNSLRDRLFSFYNENIKVVVIVDEGQMLRERMDILQELRILLNFCVSDAFLLTFIFSGQKPLDGILRNIPEFWQRLPIRFFLKNLDFNDTCSLIRFRLRKVGVEREIFAADAFEGIYQYSKGCPRVICSLADLCLLVGYSKRARRIGFVEVSTACRDMESTGDGFHYFAYVNSRDHNPRAPESQSAPSGEASTSKQAISPPPIAQNPESRVPSDATLCPRCSESNPFTRRFCRKCEAPFFRKCSKCGSLCAISAIECPNCHVDLEKERLACAERLREALSPFDTLERNHSVWLQASGVKLEREEKAIIVFPRGNFFTAGASVLRSSGAGKTVRKNCDFVLTDRRFIILIDNAALQGELARMETCVASNVRKRMRKIHTLTIGSSKGIFTVLIPRSGSKGKKISDEIVSYIRGVMLK